jgi:hypothetical protein
VNGDVGELFYLGDCPAFTLSQTGEVTRMTDWQRTDGEEDLRQRVKASQAKKDFTAKEMFQEQLAWLRSEREQQLTSSPLEVSAALIGAQFGGPRRAGARSSDCAQSRPAPKSRVPGVLLPQGFNRCMPQ